MRCDTQEGFQTEVPADLESLHLTTAAALGVVLCGLGVRHSSHEESTWLHTTAAKILTNKISDHNTYQQGG